MLAYANSMEKQTVDRLAPGSYGVIKRVGGRGAFRDRLLDMGLTPGTLVSLRKTAPMGDPIQLSLRGYELTIRKSDAAGIEIAPVTDLSLNPFKLSCDGRCVSCAKAEGCGEKSKKEDEGAAAERKDEGSLQRGNRTGKGKQE